MLVKPEELIRFVPVELKNVEILPSEDQFQKNYYTVIISDFDTQRLASSSKAYKLVSQANLSTAMTGTLEKYIRNAGVRLYDGSERQKKVLIDAAKRNEMLNSKSFHQDPVDFVILPRINSIDTFSEYREAHKAKNIFTGKEMIVPSKCYYKSTLSGTIRIYDGSSREIVESIDLHYHVSGSLKTKHRRCKDWDYIVTLARKCGEKAVKNKRTKIQNCFKPKGYVEKMMTDSQIYIIKTNIGKKNKLKAMLKAKIFTLKKEKDFFGKERTQKVQVAKGRVTYVINEKSAWIQIDAPQMNPSSVIKKGDIVEISFPDTFFDGFNDIFQGR
jgi:hypothetical protein